MGIQVPDHVAKENARKMMKAQELNTAAFQIYQRFVGHMNKDECCIFAFEAAKTFLAYAKQRETGDGAETEKIG
jgi:hypothetical protein